MVSREHGMIQVLSMSHTYGNEGCPLSVRVNVNFPPSPAPSPETDGPAPDTGNKTLRIRIGPLPISTKLGDVSPLKTLNGGERYENLVMSAEVPSLLALMGQKVVEGNVSFEVYVEVLDARGNILDSKMAGTFMYTSGVVTSVYDPGLSAPQSLKRPGEPLYIDRVSPSAPLGRRMPYDNGTLQPGQSPTVSSHQGSMDRMDYPAAYPPNVAPGGPLQQGPNGAYPTYAANVTTTWTPTSATFPNHDTPTPPQAQPLQQNNSGNSNASNSNGSGSTLQPSLMRTSQLTVNSANYNPYSGGNSKAKLELQSDLNLMAVGWDQEEWHAKRRLVQFWRRQDGPVIHAAFRPIKQTEYIPNSIVVSCIYRADKNECFVTSVDAIYLLEALVGLRFSVEEKNRIRRNLEGFRPITVSKNKSGAEDFFKLVMSFPNPKPRNIEKDVKVFPWSIFGTALKKIIGKYSASYVLPPNGNMGPPQPPTSERSGSTAPPAYNIPPPLLPAPKVEPGMQNNGYPTPATGSMPQNSGPNHHYFEPTELFSPNPSANGTPASGIPPALSAASSYHGMSSSSGSVPTLGHPGPSPGANGFVPMARQHSGMPMGGPAMADQPHHNGYENHAPMQQPQHSQYQQHPQHKPQQVYNDQQMYVPQPYQGEMGAGQQPIYK
ncbi:hypothetical protein QFC21_006891 [Naganishia friedmannii]|uniref:Uncharacterized protein n=1 Tax=Naganishia friedmannii TaxID=89922 RepID=A0ACC2UZL5_9TREE|nr:hypothetical protein QFC21_006891 [Naganishia friedmannii]